NNISTISTIATSWATHWFVLFTPKSDDSIAPVTGFYIYSNLIYKHFSSPFNRFEPCMSLCSPNMSQQDWDSYSPSIVLLFHRINENEWNQLLFVRTHVVRLWFLCLSVKHAYVHG